VTANVMSSTQLNYVQNRIVSSLIGTTKTRGLIKRAFDERDFSEHSRHPLTLLYWLSILSDHEKESHNLGRMIDYVEQKYESVQFAREQLDNDIQRGYNVLAKGLSDLVLTLVTRPFMKAIDGDHLYSSSVSPEMDELARKSRRGEKKATREAIESAYAANEDQLRDLMESVDETAIDSIMPAAPELNDNPRLERIRSMVRALRAG